MCRWPAGSAGVPGSVTSTTSAASLDSSSSASSSARARVDRRLQRLARLVGALADRTALLGRELADVAQQVRRARLYGRGSARAPLRARRLRWRRRPPPPPRRAMRRSGRRCSWAADPSGELVEGHGRRHGGVQRVGVGDRDVGDVVAGGDDVATAALRARRRRRASARRRPAARAAARLRGRRARPAGPGSSPMLRTRATGTENSAPIDARTALWPYGSALPGPSATRDGAERQRGADDRADVAGVADAPQRDAPRPDRRATSAAGRRRSRACPSRAGRPRPARAAHRDAVEAAARRRVARGRVPARGVGGVEQVLALGHELAQLVAPAPSGELADLLEGFVVGAGDLGHVVRKQKRAPLRMEGRPEKARRCAGVARPPRPRGRARRIGGRSRGRARRCRPGPCGPARRRPAAGRG